MSNPKRSKKAAAQPRNPNATIQTAAIIIIVLVAAAVLWSVIRSRPPAQPQASGDAPAAIATRQYASAPPMMIDKNKQYTATVKMANGGEFVIQLYADKAPITVNSFVFLARQGYFDGLTFHRVLEGFMAQGGDPTGTGTSGSTKPNLKQEFSAEPHVRGVCSMARTSDPNSANSQFFICFDDATFLDRQYTVWGQVESGMEHIDALPKGEPPRAPGKIVKATVN